MAKGSPIVISLGGSLIIAGKINISFLRSFRTLILKHVRKAERFIIITGGGSVAREYQAAARAIVKITDEDLDWLGIHATRLNAHLIRTLFREHADPQIITSRQKIRKKLRSPITIAAGFRPGSSTDYDAVLLAKAYDAKTILNLSNIDQVYTADPRKNKNAKPLTQMSWPAFHKLVGGRWDPGANVPFDPVASKWAGKWGMKVIITKGSDISNLRGWLDERRGQGTIIE